MAKTWNTHHINKYGTMDEILANDVRNQLQCNIEYEDWDKTGRLDVGCVIEHEGWKQFKNCKFYYQDEKVVIGNDTFNVISLRSYNTIVGFRWMGKVYILGKYSITTRKQIVSFIESISNPETIYYNRREV